jgi:hypothetical protein
MSSVGIASLRACVAAGDPWAGIALANYLAEAAEQQIDTDPVDSDDSLDFNDFLNPMRRV